MEVLPSVRLPAWTNNYVHGAGLAIMNICTVESNTGQQQQHLQPGSIYKVVLKGQQRCCSIYFMAVTLDYSRLYRHSWYHLYMLALVVTGGSSIDAIGASLDNDLLRFLKSKWQHDLLTFSWTTCTASWCVYFMSKHAIAMAFLGFPAPWKISHGHWYVEHWHRSLLGYGGKGENRKE